MKLSDYIADFLEKKKIKTAYVLTGGCVVHIIDSLAKKKKIKYIPVQHEQAGAMAADCESRVTRNISAIIATSGPGATNLLTGICCSYYDSIPVIAITGQVPKNQLKGKSKSRQIGFQETDVVSIYKSVTKYSVLIDNPQKIKYELEKAFFLATTGRPGPVLLDICDDVQRADINPNKLESFEPSVNKNQKFIKKVRKFLNLIKNSERPILIIGAGVRVGKAEKEIVKLVNKLKIPFLLTWGAMDLISHEHKLFSGNFGVTSGRAGNFAVQNSDLIITIGTRLDTHEVGSNINTFAREAKRIVIDVDESEQKKYREMNFKVDLLHTQDSKSFINEILEIKENYKIQDISNWKSKIYDWLKKYPSCDKKSRNQKRNVNPYFFINKLSESANNDSIIITDCGSNLIWTMQGFRVKGTQRLISAWNHSPMGYSLPASIGAAFAEPFKKIICITGDGGLQINIQELATIAKHKLNISIFLVNNHCHGIIQGTQQNWLKSKFHASDPVTGKLPDPEFSKIAKAYEIKAIDATMHSHLKKKIMETLSFKGPMLCNVHMNKESQIYPKLLFGKPIEDSHPLLSREEFKKEMIVKRIS